MAVKSTRKKKRTNSGRKKATETSAIRDEIIILCILAVCILLLISNFGLGGFAGNVCSGILFGIFGWLAYPIPILIFCAAAFLVSNRGSAHAYIKTAALVVFLIVLAALLGLIVNHYQPDMTLLEYYRQSGEKKHAAGLIGGLCIRLLCPFLGIVGTYVVLFILGIICVILITERSLLKPLGQGSKKAYEQAKAHHQTAVLRSRQQKEERLKEQQINRREAEEPLHAHHLDEKPVRRSKKVSGVSFSTTLIGNKSPELKELEPESMPEESVGYKASNEEDSFVEETASEAFVINRAQSETGSEIYPEETVMQGNTETDGPKAQKRQSSKKSDAAVLAADTEAIESAVQEQNEKIKKEYKIPPLNLLTRGKKTGGDSDAQLRATALKLEQTLQNFGVKVHVTNASCGPSVTRYELQPEQGVKVSKIVGLADDIKLNLAVTDLRIEAPIPGKAAVGIEVPNSENIDGYAPGSD